MPHCCLTKANLLQPTWPFLLFMDYVMTVYLLLDVPHKNIHTKFICFLIKAGSTRKTIAMLYQVFRPVVGGKK